MAVEDNKRKENYKNNILIGSLNPDGNKEKINKKAVIILITPILIYLILIFPISINGNYSGVVYSVSDDSEIIPITFKIDGKIKKDLDLKKTFVGHIKIIGAEDLMKSLEIDNLEYTDEIYEELFNSEVIFSINSDQQIGSYVQYYFSKLIQDGADLKGYGYRLTVGRIYFNKSFTEFTIKLPETDNGSVSGETDLMLSAPATTREEAVDLTNSLSKKYLDLHFGY